MKKRNVGIFKKRNSRSRVIIDEDDFNFLKLLSEVAEDNRAQIMGLELDYIKKTLNISHKALLIHVNRLKKYGWVAVARLKDKDYKMKIIFITSPGKNILKQLDEGRKILLMQKNESIK